MTPVDTILTCDVTIVGAAMVGATLASALAANGFSVVVIEKRVPPASAAGASPDTKIQTTALSLSSINILKSLGLWRFVQQTAVPIRQVQVSQAGNFGTVRLDAADQGVEALGAIMSNSHYSDVVVQQLQNNPLITLLAPAQLTAIVGNQGDGVIDESGNRLNSCHCDVNGLRYRVDSDLLLAVDGVDSQVRHLLGIEARITDYEQSAVLVNVETSEANDGVAFERFTQSGPMACLPLGGHLSSVVCSIDADQHEQFVAMNDEQLCGALQQRFGYRLGRFMHCGPHHVVALKLTEAVCQSQGRALLIGNAARTLHPVAGQGFNLALRDVGLLLELMQNAPKPLDSITLLQKFCDLRQRDQSLTVGLTDVLAKVFRGSNTPFSHLRGMGLLTMEHVPGLRRQFARQAMGLANRLPDLAKPSKIPR